MSHEIDERFVAFLRREGARYHAPPETPADGMWPAIEAEWRRRDPLLAAAEDYHRPPEAPREAMWARIEAAWRLRAAAPPGAREAGWEALSEPGAPAPESEGRHEDRAERRRPLPARLAWTAGIAAALVLGILIGRGTLLGPSGASDRVAVETDVGRTAGPVDDPTAVDASGAAEVARASEAETRPAGRTAADPADAGNEAAGRSQGEDAAAADRLAGGPDASPADVGGGRETDGTRAATERLATERHLARVETFLTSFRQEENGYDDVPDTGPWARELLAETRLLLDWSTEADPRLRTLLQELELLLAQIVRLDGAAAERDWVVDAMERRGVLPRLRSTAQPRTVGAAGT